MVYWRGLCPTVAPVNGDPNLVDLPACFVSLRQLELPTAAPLMRCGIAVVVDLGLVDGWGFSV